MYFSIEFLLKIAVKWVICPNNHNILQHEIFYIWGPSAFSYFDLMLNNDQLNTSIQASPLTSLWILKKKTTDEYLSVCFLASGTPNIIHLSLRNQSISGTKSFSSLCTLLDSLPNLKYLDLSIFYIYYYKLKKEGNGLKVSGWNQICDKVEKKKDLDGLDLSGNNLGDEGAKKIALTIKKLEKLQWISLGNNNIGDEGMALICDAIEKNKFVKLLDLSKFMLI